MQFKKKGGGVVSTLGVSLLFRLSSCSSLCLRFAGRQTGITLKTVPAGPQNTVIILRLACEQGTDRANEYMYADLSVCCRVYCTLAYTVNAFVSLVLFAESCKLCW